MKILYLTNFYLSDVIEQRNAMAYVSQAGQNKSQYMRDMLQEGGNRVIVWSNAWTKSTSLKWYKGFHSKLDENVYYADIYGLPFFNVFFCKHSCKRFLRKLVKQHEVDAIIFYNMRLENTPVALWAKRKWNIPIFLQYEDGLTQDAGVTGLKKFLYQKMEKSALPLIDGAFLVNSKISVSCPSVVIRGVIKSNVSKPPEMPDRKETMPTILFASTLDRQRGIRVLLEALTYTEAEFRLVITGRGSGEADIQHCRDQRVQYLGYLPYEAYDRLLDEADICINAQLSDSSFGNFSFPSKISEYLQHYKLVVSSDVADTKEVLSDVLFLYENDDPRCMAKQIEKAIDVWKNPIYYRTYMERVSAYLEENSIQNIADKVNCMMKHALGADH